MIFLDGSPADLNARFARDVKLDEAPYAEGFALTPSAAMDAQQRKLRSATLLQTLALWAALAAIVWLSKAGVGVFLVGALAFPVIFYAYGGYRNSVWRGGVELRLGLTPAAETRVWLDGTGLHVAGELTKWRDLRLEQADLVSAVHRYGRSLFVDRVEVAGPAVRYALDRTLLSNGQQIVDGIYLRLSPSETDG